MYYWLSCYVVVCIAYRDLFWPNGVLAEPAVERKPEQKSRARVVALAKMLGSVPGNQLLDCLYILWGL